jgi:tetratricopeptide (TPR) repeat protein
MAEWKVFNLYQQELQKINTQLAHETGNKAELYFQRAIILENLGKNDAAKDAYIQCIAHEPEHLNALLNFAALLYRLSYHKASILAYEQAFKFYPTNIFILNALGKIYLIDKKLDLARQYFEKTLQLDPNNIEAHKGLGSLFMALGDVEAAEPHKKIGYYHQPIIVLPFLGEKTPIPILLLISADSGNVSWQQHLDQRVFLISIMVVESFTLETKLPPHVLVINAVGDADLCVSALHQVEKILQRTSTSIIN